ENPFGEGSLSIVVFPLGLCDRPAGLVAASRRPEFPTEVERVVLQVAANLATIAVSEAVARRRGGRALAGGEEELHRVADSIPEVIWISRLEPEERIVYASPSFERVWGLPLEDLHRNARLWMESIDPEDRERVVQHYSEWIAGTRDSYEDVEFRIVRPD